MSNIDLSPKAIFNNNEYQLVDKARFDNFDLLEIDFLDKTILELGSGIGNHTDFIISKKPKKVVTIEGRLENYQILENKYQNNKSVFPIHYDLEKPFPKFDDKFDWVYHYGLLYHLKNPFDAIDYLNDLAHDNLILETCVELNGLANNLEEGNTPSQALNGIGSRPNLTMIKDKLENIYQQVIIPIQPNHTWYEFNAKSELKRIVIICLNKK
jgi:hypothetical protein